MLHKIKTQHGVLLLVCVRLDIGEQKKNHIAIYYNDFLQKSNKILIDNK